VSCIKLRTRNRLVGQMWTLGAPNLHPEPSLELSSSKITCILLHSLLVYDTCLMEQAIVPGLEERIVFEIPDNRN